MTHAMKVLINLYFIAQMRVSMYTLAGYFTQIQHDMTHNLTQVFNSSKQLTM